MCNYPHVSYHVNILNQNKYTMTSPKLRDVRFYEINGVMEEFEIVRIGRKYIYWRSSQYGSDGLWRNLKSDISSPLHRV